MRHHSTIISKGEITIPIEILNALGLADGDWVVMEPVKRGLSIRARNSGETIG